MGVFGTQGGKERFVRTAGEYLKARSEGFEPQGGVALVSGNGKKIIVPAADADQLLAAGEYSLESLSSQAAAQAKKRAARDQAAVRERGGVLGQIGSFGIGVADVFSGGLASQFIAKAGGERARRGLKAFSAERTAGEIIGSVGTFGAGAAGKGASRLARVAEATPARAISRAAKGVV